MFQKHGLLQEIRRSHERGLGYLFQPPIVMKDTGINSSTIKQRLKGIYTIQFFIWSVFVENSQGHQIKQDVISDVSKLYYLTKY